MERAIRDVSAGRAERICAPGLWVVWRDGESVRVRVMASTGRINERGVLYPVRDR